MAKSATLQRPWSLEAIHFYAYQEAAASAIKKVRSGEKTQLRLLASGARLLENHTFQDLQIEQVSADAGMAKGTFYIHFESKDIFLRQLASRYAAFEQQTFPTMNAGEDVFLDACRWVAWYERTFAANSGMIRCIVRMGETDEFMQDLWHDRNERVTTRIVSDLLQRVEPASGNSSMLRLAVRSAGGMLDQSLFNRYRVQTSTGLEDHEDSEFLILFHAILMYRAVLGSDPVHPEAKDILQKMQMTPKRRS